MNWKVEDRAKRDKRAARAFGRVQKSQDVGEGPTAGGGAEATVNESGEWSSETSPL